MQSWIPLVPERASTFAGKVDALYFYLSGVTLFFTLLISATLIFFVIRYRRRSPYEIPRPVAGSHKLETIWTIIPFLIVIGMALPATKAAEAIKKYGEASAFRRACGIRRRMEQQMYGEPVEAKWVETLSKLCAA